MAKNTKKKSAKKTRKASPQPAAKKPPAKKKAARSSSPAPRADELPRFCRSLPGVTEDIKWGHDLVFSVGKKMFAAFDVDDATQYGFRCTEEDQDRLTQLDGIIPAPYAAHYGWVAIRKKGALPAAEAKRLIKLSYDLVLSGLSKRLQRELTPNS